MIRVYQQETLDIFSLAQNVIKDSFSLVAQDQGHITLPKNAHNPLRQQYSAAVILDDIASKKDKEIEYKLCLVNVDIYVQNMNFIFGHLFGLVHCTNNKCIMHFSNTVKDTDEKEQTFCQNCRSRIE